LPPPELLSWYSPATHELQYTPAPEDTDLVVEGLMEIVVEAL
jgi:hypothetical protein